MSRRYADPIQVWTTGPAAASSDAATGPVPGQFRWRGCRYRVTDLLGQWVEAGAWWREPEPEPDPGRTVAGPAGTRPVGDQRVWRVEAVRVTSTGRRVSGVFDLCSGRPVEGATGGEPGEHRQWWLLGTVD